MKEQCRRIILSILAMMPVASISLAATSELSTENGEIQKGLLLGDALKLKARLHLGGSMRSKFKLLALAALILGTQVSFAATKCQEKATSDEVLKVMNKRLPLDAESRTLGDAIPFDKNANAKATEVYKVGASDAVGPSLWLVALDAKTCKLRYVGLIEAE